MSTVLTEPRETPDVQIVFDALRKYKAMPLLEIAAVTGFSDKRVREIVDALAREKKVKVANPDRILDAIVTLSWKCY